MPPGYYGRVAPRSGLAVKNFIDVGAGVIDEDYRGEVKVLLFNFSDQDFQVKTGDRIAQLVCEQVLGRNYKNLLIQFFRSAALSLKKWRSLMTRSVDMVALVRLVLAMRKLRVFDTPYFCFIV